MSDHPNALLLGVAANEKTSNVALSIYKDMKKEADASRPSAEVVEEVKKAGFTVGRKVRRNWCEAGSAAYDDIGEVVNHNLSQLGFYPGYRYPIIVKFAEGTFEYGPTELVLLTSEELEKLI